jgi:hypothetical protein
MKKNVMITMRFWVMLLMYVLAANTSFSQEEQQWEEGDLKDVEIEIIKERQIVLPNANRNFEKIPPKPSEPIKSPIQYNFRSFSVLSAQANPALRPLRLKQEDPSKVYGGYVTAGYGNYASPYLEGFINTRKNKNQLVGAHAYLKSSGKGPVDGKNSASGNAGVSIFGRSFSEYVSLSGEAEFENRSTHFYGYPENADVEASTIRQSYNDFRLSGSITNAKNTSFSYKLGGGFSYLTDRFDAKETDVDINFISTYKLDGGSAIGIKAGYSILSRSDSEVEAKPRSLLNINPSYVFYPIEDLRFSAGVVASFENDTIDNKDVHAYPDLHASYPISPSVNATASLTGGVEKVSLHTLSNENMWIAPNIPIFHTNKLYDLTIALNTRIGNKVAVNGGVSAASLKNWYFFVNDVTDMSKFTTIYEKKGVERINLFASIGFAQTEAAKIMVRGDWYSYVTDELAEPYHRPTYKLTADASFNIYKKLLLDFDVIAQGGMVGYDYTETTNNGKVELDPAFDLNARMEYLVSGSFSFFVQANNILDNQYPLFMNYPVRGFQVLGGLTWSF